MTRAAATPVAATTAMLGAELRLTARRGETLLVTFAIPPVILVTFASLAILPTGAGRPVEFLLPGSIALAIIATSLVGLGITTAYDRFYGVLKRLGGSPLSRGELIAAKVGAVLVVEAIQVGLLVAVGGLVLGWSPGPGASPGLAFVAVLLGTLAFAGLGLFLAGTLRAETMLAVANGLFVAFLVVGGIVVPLDHLPGPLAALGGILPAAPLSEALRIALGGASGDPLGPLAILAGWAVATIGLATRTFRWE